MATFAETAARLKSARSEAARIVQRETRRASLKAEAAAKVNATNRLAVRSGFLRASIRGQVAGTGLRATVRLAAGGPAVPYAGIQDLGGTVYPKRAKMLAIPLQDRLRGISPKNLGEPGTFILTHNGKPFIVQSTDDGLVFLYRLVSSVTLRPTYYLRDAFQDAIKELRTRLQTALTPVLTSIRDLGGKL